MSGKEKKFIKLLQEANKRNDDLLERLEEVCDERDRWESSYRELYKDKCRLENQLFCASCQEEKQRTPEGKTFVLCGKCADNITDWKKTVITLVEKGNYWKQCYESLLEDTSCW